MQTISEIMTRDVTVLSPDSTIQKAAQLMRDQDIGAVPICNGKKLVGMITDRDIVIRALAEANSSTDMKVSEVMTDEVLWCFEDEQADDVLRKMGDQQIRRIPVVNRDKELCGVVSLGDLATRQGKDTDEALEKISAPIPPDPSAVGGHSIRR